VEVQEIQRLAHTLVDALLETVGEGEGDPLGDKAYDIMYCGAVLVADLAEMTIRREQGDPNQTPAWKERAFTREMLAATLTAHFELEREADRIRETARKVGAWAE